jgi:hypothetical protein
VVVLRQDCGGRDLDDSECEPIALDCASEIAVGKQLRWDRLSSSNALIR